MKISSPLHGLRYPLLLVLTLMAIGPHSLTAQENRERPPLQSGEVLPEFELKDFIGKTYSAQDFADSKVLVVYFFGTECPIAKFYSVRLQQELDKHQDKGIAIIGIDSNQQDSIRDLAAYAKTNDLKFPLLKDPGNRIADAFGAARTPEVFLFDADRKLRYRGAIDDQYHYGLQRLKVEKEYLKDAVTAILNDAEVPLKQTEAVGCLIGRKLEQDKNAKVTFSNQISRILNDNCVACHRPGEVAPFSLTDYEEVSGWAEMIREVINERRMPPWHANPAHGKFANDASLSKDEIELINQWVEAGAPEGNPDDLPPTREFPEGWQIGKPDLVVPMANKPFRVPATGVIDYQYFVVDPGFKEDKYIKAAECRIGNRAVVHHIIVAADSGRRGRSNPAGHVRSEWITATAPGSPPLVLPEGYAKFVPAGSKLVFQMHYTPVGTAQDDLSKVGFIFAQPEEVKKVVGTREIVNRDFRIPPNTDNFRVIKNSRPLPKDALVLSLFPHMHLRGKSFQYIAKYPDGTSEVLLDIPNYDFNWQNGYLYKKPKELPKGTVIKCIAHFDNSKDNLANPNPDRTVTWGDQTWDEMMIGYFDMTWK